MRNFILNSEKNVVEWLLNSTNAHKLQKTAHSDGQDNTLLIYNSLFIISVDSHPDIVDIFLKVLKLVSSHLVKLNTTLDK